MCVFIQKLARKRCVTSWHCGHAAEGDLKKERLSRNVTQKWKDKGIPNNYQSKFISLFKDLRKTNTKQKKERKANQRMMAHRPGKGNLVN